MSKLLTGKGFPAGDVSNATYADGTTSTIYYGTGADTDAKQLSEMFGGIPVSPSSSVSAGHVKLVVGADLDIPASLDPAATTTSLTTSAAWQLTDQRRRRGRNHLGRPGFRQARDDYDRLEDPLRELTRRVTEPHHDEDRAVPESAPR